MRKIVVFDSGWGGELVADFLMRELAVVEVIRIIDWAHKIYTESALNVDMAAEMLAPYVGKVDLIVLGGYLVGTMLPALKRIYPTQKFVSLGINYNKILHARHRPEKIAVLMNPMLKYSAVFQELREKLPFATLFLPDCATWEHLIDNNLMTKETVRMELAWDFKIKNGIQYRPELDKAKGEIPLASSEKSATLVTSMTGKQAIAQAIQKFAKASQSASEDEQSSVRTAMQMQEDFLKQNAVRQRVEPDLVLLLNTHFWDVKQDIEQCLGWQVGVLDFREKLLHDVCASLELRGLHGKRAK